MIVPPHCTCDWPGEAFIPHRPWCATQSLAAPNQYWWLDADGHDTCPCHAEVPADPASNGVSGLDRSRRAVADAAGWPWCEEHRCPRWDGFAPCSHLHSQPSSGTYDEDGAPEPPFGGQYR